MELLLPIVLVVVGLALMAVEVYLIPGLNIVGILGALLVVFAVGYAFTETGALGGLLTFGGAGAAGAALFYWMWNSGAWDRFVLSASLERDPAADEAERDQRARFLGQRGTAVTSLRPEGVADISGDRIEVATKGEFIAAGSLIEVVAMDRRRYFVRLATALPAPRGQSTEKV